MQQAPIPRASLARLPLPAAVALALMALATSPARAADAPPAAPATDNGKLESVIVTANKRAQNLQDVPASITVLNDAVLQRANVRDLEDVPSLSPALTLSYGTQPGNFSINRAAAAGLAGAGRYQHRPR
jgi:iron complex outermembrane recepter protein